MLLFKKPEKGFLAKLFKHKQVEELAEELAHTYADEMQEELQSERYRGHRCRAYTNA